MAYLQHTSWKGRPGAVAGVVAIHAVIGYALITGLSFSSIVDVVDNPKGIFVPEVKLPPPPPSKPEPRPSEAVIDRPVVVPVPPLDMSANKPLIDTTPDIVPQPDPIAYVVPRPTPSASAGTLPSFTPTGVKPRGNPANWVTVNDYRTNWINREMTGTARFRLEVGAGGRVESCTITTSSGHDELDRATCALVTQRARFDPAKDETGAKVSGTYSNAVRWELPE